MFMMIVLGAASLVVVGSSLLLLDCSIASLSLFAGDPLQVCETVDQLGLGGNTALTAGFAAFGLIAVVGSWLEAYRRVRKAKVEPVNSLARNLDRIDSVLPHGDETEAASDETLEPQVSSTLDSVGSAWAELESLESLYESEDQGSGDLSARWLALIRDANDLHNRGEIDTDDFKILNTRILALLSEPRTSESRAGVLAST